MAAVRAAFGHAVWLRRRTRLRRRAPGRRVVVVGLVEHIGDIVAAEPIIRQLRRREPGAFLVWGVRPRYRELLDGHPDIDGILSVDCLGEWIALSSRRTWDEVIDLHVIGRACVACGARIGSSAGRAPITLANYYDHGPLLEVFRRVGGLDTPADLSNAPTLYIPPRSHRAIDRLHLPDTFVAVHALSDDPRRDWTVEKWRNLHDRLAADGVEVVEVGVEAVMGSDSPRYHDLCGRLSILETAELIRRASLFVGVDSGPAHLANAVGTPGVILLGRYADFERYTPYAGGFGDGTNATLIHESGPADAIPVARVLEEARVWLHARSPAPIDIPAPSGRSAWT